MESDGTAMEQPRVSTDSDLNILEYGEVEIPECVLHIVSAGLLPVCRNE
jgi:hypothetical protein